MRERETSQQRDTNKGFETEKQTNREAGVYVYIYMFIFVFVYIYRERASDTYVFRKQA